MAIKSFRDEFPEADELLSSNPGLALCIAHSDTWDSTGGYEHPAFKQQLLRMKRRKACGFLGFPENESSVTLLAKILPEACSIGLLMKLRLKLKITGLLKILLQGAHITALDNTMTMHRLKGQGRLKPFRSSSEIWAQHDKLVEWLAPQIRQERKDLCDLVFPPPPLSGTPSIHPITSSELLLEEGKTQHHCASIYAEAVATGHVYFYRMFEPERVTICIERCNEAWVLKEAKTTCNAEIQPDTSRQISVWLVGMQQKEPAQLSSGKTPHEWQNAKNGT
jgi:hypothetical protein